MEERGRCYFFILFCSVFHEELVKIIRIAILNSSGK
jgi:hypothetical protein